MYDRYVRSTLTKEEAEIFIGDNASFYLEKWDTHSHSGLKGWNWAAAIFGIEWMAYRQLYAEALVYLLFFSLAAFCLSVVLMAFQTSINFFLFRHIFRLVLGVFGNALYYRKAQRELKKGLAEGPRQALPALKHMGGTSKESVIVCLFVKLALRLLLWF